MKPTDDPLVSHHRACLGVEHDTDKGKMHGCCVVCGEPWPCAFELELQDLIKARFRQPDRDYAHCDNCDSHLHTAEDCPAP